MDMRRMKTSEAKLFVVVAAICTCQQVNSCSTSHLLSLGPERWGGSGAIGEQKQTPGKFSTFLHDESVSVSYNATI
jgi:hypothetical protein